MCRLPGSLPEACDGKRGGKAAATWECDKCNTVAAACTDCWGQWAATAMDQQVKGQRHGNQKAVQTTRINYDRLSDSRSASRFPAVYACNLRNCPGRMHVQTCPSFLVAANAGFPKPCTVGPPSKERRRTREKVLSAASGGGGGRRTTTSGSSSQRNTDRRRKESEASVVEVQRQLERLRQEKAAAEAAEAAAKAEAEQAAAAAEAAAAVEAAAAAAAVEAAAAEAAAAVEAAAATVEVEQAARYRSGFPASPPDSVEDNALPDREAELDRREADLERKWEAYRQMVDKIYAVSTSVVALQADNAALRQAVAERDRHLELMQTSLTSANAMISALQSQDITQLIPAHPWQ